MNNKYVLILMVFLSSLAVANEKKVVGVVFHSSYCEAIPEARLSYLNAIKRKGYTVFDLCVSSRSISGLKADIETEVGLRNIKWKDVEGINIIGPVVDTLLLPSLSNSQNKSESSVAELMFDDLVFSYQNPYLTGVESGYFMPSKVRWVSQLFAEDLAWDLVVRGLAEAEARMVSAGEVGCGARFADGLLAALERWHVGVFDDWTSLPDGIGWNLMAPLFTVSSWYLMGISRKMWGYSEVNRLQTTTDKVMYIGVIYPGLAIINFFSVYSLIGHFRGESLPNDDRRWKKYILNQRLRVDGLAGLGFCGREKNKAP